MEGGGGQGKPVRPPKWPNPRERELPSPETLREQMRYAYRMYGRAYSEAWGAAIAVGLGMFALGWYVQGGNPLETRPAPEMPHGAASETNGNKKT